MRDNFSYKGRQSVTTDKANDEKAKAGQMLGDTFLGSAPLCQLCRRLAFYWQASSALKKADLLPGA
jgi:hypothetical protein